VTLVPVQWSTPPAETALEHCQRGIALTNEGYYEQAIAEFNKAIELDPNRFTPYYGRGLAYKEQGKKDEAIHILPGSSRQWTVLRIDNYTSEDYT